MAQAQDQFMTVEEFLALEEANPEGIYEYIDGYVRDLGALLMAGGSSYHAAITNNISTALTIALRKSGRKCLVFSAQVSFRPITTRYFHPDVTVSCHPQETTRNNAEIVSASLVVEVLSPTTEMFDRSRKLQIYSACPSIQEYLLVDANRPFVEVYHRLPSGKMEYSTYHADEHIPLNGLGIELPVNEIYIDIIFD